MRIAEPEAALKRAREDINSASNALKEAHVRFADALRREEEARSRFEEGSWSDGSQASAQDAEIKAKRDQKDALEAKKAAFRALTPALKKVAEVVRLYAEEEPEKAGGKDVQELVRLLFESAVNPENPFFDELFSDALLLVKRHAKDAQSGRGFLEPETLAPIADAKAFLESKKKEEGGLSGEEYYLYGYVTQLFANLAAFFEE